jgi:hypothetical protein
VEDEEEKRQIFAGLAMIGLLSGQTNRHARTIIEHDTGDTKINVTVARSIALDAVAHADALIVVLKEKELGKVPKETDSH